MDINSNSRIAIISGGLDYEKKDIEKATYDVKQSLLRHGYKTITVNLDRVDFLDIIVQFAPDLSFIIDPFYVVNNNEIKDVRELLNKLKLNYIGSTPEVAAICKDKALSKKYFQQLNITTPNHIHIVDFPSMEWLKMNCEKLGFPVILKPLSEGAGVGVYLCNDIKTVINLIPITLHKYKNLLLEEYIDGIEITVGVIGNYTNPTALCPIELELLSSLIYDYNTKMNSDAVKRYAPARLPNEQLKELENMSCSIHSTIGCKGVSRIDYRVKNNQIVCIEINASPALAEDEHIARAAYALGLSYDELIKKIIIS